MKKKNIYLKGLSAAFAVAALFSSCTEESSLIPSGDKDSRGMSDLAVDTSAPIQFSARGYVNPDVSSTRAIDYDKQDGAFDKNTKFGMFIIHEYRCRVNEMSTLSETNTGYLNVPMVMDDLGNLTLKSKIDTAWVNKYNPKHPDLANKSHWLYYPQRSVWEGEADSLVTAIGYAPYKEDRTWDELDSQKKGFPFNVCSFQNESDSVLQSDLLIGQPSGAKMFRTTAKVPLEFKHALTKVNLELHIVKSDSTICDSLYVRMINAPKKALLKFSYDAEEGGPVYKTTLNTSAVNNVGVIRIGAVANPLSYPTTLNEKGEEEVVFHLSGIIVPSAINSDKRLQFAVVLRHRSVEYTSPVFVGVSKRNDPYEAGTEVNYRMTVRGSENYSIYVPDSGDDSWIVGKPVE